LHLASKEGHINIVTELIDRGALVDGSTKVCCLRAFAISAQSHIQSHCNNNLMMLDLDQHCMQANEEASLLVTWSA